jgi:hypothetical protein
MSVEGHQRVAARRTRQLEGSWYEVSAALHGQTSRRNADSGSNAFLCVDKWKHGNCVDVSPLRTTDMTSWVPALEGPYADE